MSGESTLIILVLGVLSLAILGWPFMQQRNRKGRQRFLAAERERDELLTAYERVLATIRDLDEDYNTGKLRPDVYQQDREYWAAEGIKLLEQLDPKAAAAEAATSKPQRRSQRTEQPVEADRVLDDAIEDAILAYRRAQSEA